MGGREGEGGEVGEERGGEGRLGEGEGRGGEGRGGEGRIGQKQGAHQVLLIRQGPNLHKLLPKVTVLISYLSCSQTNSNFKHIIQSTYMLMRKLIKEAESMEGEGRGNGRRKTGEASVQ